MNHAFELISRTNHKTTVVY